MASTATPEASEIRRRGRQRLIGAVVLVALLVVFVPMLLDSEPKPAREAPNLVIPPKDPVQPLPMPAPKAASTAPAIDPAKSAPAKADAAPAEPAKAPAPKVATEPPKAPAGTSPAPSVAGPAPAAASVTPTEPAKAAPAAQPPHGGFAVQVGAFRDEAKLKQARDKLAAARVPHYTERLETKGGGLTRLRAGPFETREKAEAALAALRRASLDGKVVPLP